MLDQTINDALRLTGEPSIDTNLSFTSLDHERYATINARALDDDDTVTLARFLTDESADDGVSLAAAFIALWEAGRVRDAVKTLVGVCTVELNLSIPLTEQTDR